MSLLAYVLVFFAVFFGVLVILSFLFDGKSRVRERLEEIKKIGQNAGGEEDILEKPFTERVGIPLVHNFVNFLGRLTPGDYRQSMEKKIMHAGNPINISSLITRQVFLGLLLPLLFIFLDRLPHSAVRTFFYFLASGAYVGILSPIFLKVVLIPLLLVIFRLLLWGEGNPLAVLFLWFFIGLIVPVIFLNFQVRWRQKVIQNSLPDTLDLLLVSVEAGLGFDMALKKVVEEKPGELSRELKRALEEVRVGKTRAEALRGVVDRTGVEDVRNFINAVIQAERLGTNIAKTLGIQADSMRVKRRQRAQEAAARAPIWMLFPLLFFILPALFIVILGPPLVRLWDFFAEGLFL